MNKSFLHNSILSKITAVGLIIMLFSCNSILDEEPITFYNEQQVFSTEEGVETAINGLWYSFGGPGYHGSSFHGLLAPLSGRFHSLQAANNDAISLNCSPINTWLIRLWPDMFFTINDANVIINNLENTDVDLENKEFALGQAYLLRGLTYFDLVRLFGGVPIRTEPSTAETLHLPRSTEAEVYDQVISDLEKAKELLPDFGEYRSERPVKYVANVYLSKVYMTLAGQDGGNPALWQNAKDQLSPVIGKYSLVPTYNELFELGNENTEESILELQYDHFGAVRNADLIRAYTPSNSIYTDPNARTFGWIRPNKEVYDEHLNQYPGDPRFSSMFLDTEYEKTDGKFQKIYPQIKKGRQAYPFITKYFDETYNGTTTMRNVMLTRYADVLLMMAEIENELNGPDAGYEYVNQVLARARDIDGDGVSDAEEPADWSGMDQGTFRAKIMKERQFELLGECHDWFDSRRRGYDYFLQEIVIKHNSHPDLDLANGFEYPTDMKNMKLPIPSAEIAGNQLVTPEDQNPGY